jgi:hypothetical protein
MLLVCHTDHSLGYLLLQALIVLEMPHSHIPNVQCGQQFIPISAKQVRNLVVSVSDLIPARSEQLEMFASNPIQWANLSSRPALLMGMDEVILDRIAFGCCEGAGGTLPAVTIE